MEGPASQGEVTAPPRPTQSTPAMKRRVAEALIDQLEPESIGMRESMIGDMVRCGDLRKDGYELARTLERERYWDCDFRTAETLDSFASMLRHEVDEAQKAWVAEHNIQPPLPLGTRVVIRSRHGEEFGTLDTICDYGPAKYRVKIDGEAENTRRIINFEDAVSAR